MADFAAMSDLNAAPSQPPPVSSEWETRNGTPKKPGWRTTEFWVSLAALIVGTILATHGQDLLGGMIITSVVQAYVGIRTVAKK